ncbi:MAG: NINE protein [Methylococcales bacterium]|nr:NINE protein [Methylococcales bacterium]
MYTRIKAALFAIFFGCIGTHKFYLGRFWVGIVF